MMDVTGRESETRIRKRDVVFLTAKLGYSRESTKSKNHSSSNISAIHKQSETAFCRKYHKFSQRERKHGSFRSVVERKHKNERTASGQRATFHNGAARCVFSSACCARCARIPCTKAQNHSHIARRFPPNDPPPRDHRSMEAQKNSRENKNNGPLSCVSPLLNRKTPPLSRSAREHCGEAFAPFSRTYALTEFRLFAFTLHHPTTTHTISTIFG